MRKILPLLILFFSLHAHSQDCSVNLETLKGTYEGDCKKGKADGEGTATGLDSYTGEFKNGYPEGKGKYFWKNGDWFDGQWKKGLREGQGTMHYIGKNSKDSTQTGFWKKDKYAGKYQNPYIVHYKTPDVVGLDISRENNLNKEITFVMQSTRGGAMALGSQIPKITITDISIMSGQFMTRSDDYNMPKTNKTVLRGVEFPLRIKVVMDSDIIEIEFLEEGRYNIDVRVNR